MLPVEDHHQFEEFCFVDFYWDLFQRVVSVQVCSLQVCPLEVVLEGEFVFESEGLVRVYALQTGLVVVDKEKTGVDIILRGCGVTS